MPYQPSSNLSQPDNQNLMPSISQQLNNLNLSNQNMFLQNQLTAGAMMNMGGQINNTGINNNLINSGGISQEQLKLLLAFQNQNNVPPPKIPEPSYENKQFTGIGMQPPPVSPTPQKFPASSHMPASVSNMSDLTK